MQKYTLLLFLVLSGISVRAQEKDSLLAVIQTHKNDTDAVNAYIRLSAIISQNNYDSSLYFASQACKLAQEIGYAKGESDSYLRMGNAHNFKGQYDSAAAAYESAYQIFQKLDQPLKMAKALNNLGLIYRYMADYPRSIDYFIKALDLKKKYGSRNDVAVGYQNLGIIYAITGEHEVAEPYISDAAEIFRQQGDSAKYYSTLIDLSSLLRESGQYARSKTELTKALNYHRRKNNKTSIAICIYNMGYTSDLEENYEESIGHYSEAKQLFNELGNKVRLVGCILRLGRAYSETKNWGKAEAELKEGLDITSTLNSPAQRYKLHLLLAEVYASTNRYAEAYLQRINYEEVKDSLSEEEQQVKILELTKKYEKELGRREIAELTAQNDKSELAARKKKVQNYILWGVIIIVAQLAWLFYSRARNKQRMNAALREKNQVIQHSLDEKEVLLREIHHRVQNNLQFVSSLLNLQARRIKDQKTVDVLKECKLRIQSMALIHQKLYQEERLNGINIHNYTSKLLESLVNTYNVDLSAVNTRLEVDDILLNINTAIPIGLILNELITNAFKYAFDGSKQGELLIEIKKEGAGLIMKVNDNGPGLPPDFDSDKQSSFGLKLVSSLSKKLHADLSFNNEGGTSVIITIKDIGNHE